MRTPRARRERQQVDLSPPRQDCPACHEALTERYPKQRWIIRLDQDVKVVSHFLECSPPEGERPGAVDRPYPEDALALRGYTFGMEGVVRLGELRYANNVSITRISSQLQTASPLSICLKEVALLCEVFLALVTAVARQDQELIEPVSPVGRIVLAIDGVQPANSHATLAMVRDVCSGRVVGAKTRLSSAPREIARLLAEVLR